MREGKIRGKGPCWAAQAHAVLAALLVVFVAPAAAQKAETSQRQVNDQASAPSRNHPPSGSQCETKSQEQIVITCNYSPASGPSSPRERNSRIAITRAVISFRPDDASNLRAELTFKNTGRVRSSDARTVYLEIDADTGSNNHANNNYVRRSLPTVDFQKLSPGKAVTFSEQLRVAAFPPGHYTIALWIPSSEPALKFNSAQNFLISSTGVPDPQTGLNILAKFTVEARHY